MSKDESSAGKKGFSYKESGVCIDSGNKLIELIKPMVKKTNRPGILSGLGGFGGLFELPKNLKNPVLVSGTDGVGTKLKLAIMLDQYETIGIDLVAMCVNDIIVTGAEPLYFLDYYATGQLDATKAAKVIKGITDGCIISNCALIGGETAEMPGMYDDGDFDLAGFAVGIIEKENLIDVNEVKSGDILLGLESSGPHSNGYSLIRKIIDYNKIDLNEKINTSYIGKALLEPTRIYVESVLNLLKEIEINSIAHITGGGLTENIPRVIPDGLDVEIFKSAWDMPEIFEWLKELGKIEEKEMLRTFNCGIGLVLCISDKNLSRAKKILEASGERVYEIGRIINSKNEPSKVIYR